MLLFVSLIAMLFLSAVQIFPAFVSDVLHGQADTLGWVLGASGGGTLLGTLILVPLAQRYPRPGVAVGLAIICSGVLMMMFALSTSLIPALVCIALSGASAAVVITVPAGVMQLMTPQAMWGRVVSVRLMLGFGMVPFGSLLIGILAQTFGSAAAILFYGVLLIFGAVCILALRPELRYWLTTPGVVLSQE
jgi:predicted MFS family arabinose efflux permease